jgi:hypothetical protein
MATKKKVKKRAPYPMAWAILAGQCQGKPQFAATCRCIRGDVNLSLNPFRLPINDAYVFVLCSDLERVTVRGIYCGNAPLFAAQHDGTIGAFVELVPVGVGITVLLSERT